MLNLHGVGSMSGAQLTFSYERLFTKMEALECNWSDNPGELTEKSEPTTETQTLSTVNQR